MSEQRSQCALGLSRETLSAWRDRLLPEADAQRIALHVTDCTTCQYRLTQFAQIASAMQRQHVPDLRAQTWRGIQTRLAQRGQRPMRIPRAATFGSIGAVSLLALIAVLFVLVLNLHPFGTTGPATATATPVATTTPTGTVSCQITPPPSNALPPGLTVPPGTVGSGTVGAAAIGNGVEEKDLACTPGGTQASINAYMNSHLPGAGWRKWNPATDVSGCPDKFWTWVNGNVGLYWDFTTAGRGAPYWTIWLCGSINPGN